MRRLGWWCLIAFVAGMLMGCRAQPSSDNVLGMPEGFSRYVDTTYHVVCYTYLRAGLTARQNYGAIACAPYHAP